MKSDSKEISELVKNLIDAAARKNVSFRQLTHELSVSKQAVYNWKNEVAVPSSNRLAILDRLCEKYLP